LSTSSVYARILRVNSFSASGISFIYLHIFLILLIYLYLLINFCHFFFISKNIQPQTYSFLKDEYVFIINARGGMIDHSQDASENVISVANVSTVK
jgi:hypothetical protein